MKRLVIFGLDGSDRRDRVRSVLARFGPRAARARASVGPLSTLLTPVLLGTRLASCELSRLAIAASSWGLVGCSLLGRVSVVPNVDTYGAVGVEAKVTVGVGITTTFDHERSEEGNIGLVSVPVSAAGGMRGRNGARAEAGFDGGLEYASVGRHPTDVGFRTALLFASRFEQSEPVALGATLSGALLWTVASKRAPGFWSGSRLAWGPAFEASALGTKDEPAVGRLGVGFALDGYNLTQWTVR